MRNAALSGKPYAENPHVWFDEGEVESYPPTAGRPEGVATRGARSWRGSLFYNRFACFIAVCLSLLSGQARGKALFAMRVDDNKSPQRFKEIARCFEDEGLRVTFAVNAARLSPAQGACLRALAARGHEIADHTPNHDIFKVDCPTEDFFDRGRRMRECADADPKERMVFFRPDFDFGHPCNVTFRAAMTNGCLVVSAASRKLARWIFQRGRKFTVSSLGTNRVFGVVGEMRPVADYWGRPLPGAGLDLPEQEMTALADMAHQPSEAVLRFLADVTRHHFDAFGLPRPTAWLQPGGWEPRVSWALLKRVYGDEYGYRFANGGAEPAPDGTFASERDRQAFSMRSCNRYFDDLLSVEQVCGRVAREMADGHPFNFISHCSATRLPGGFPDWRDRSRQFARWFARQGFPRGTLTDLTAELHEVPTNAAARVCTYRMTPDVISRLRIETTPRELAKDVVLSNDTDVLCVDPSVAFAKGATAVRIVTPASDAPKGWGEVVIGFQAIVRGAAGAKMSFEAFGTRYDEYEKRIRGWSVSRAPSQNVLDAHFRCLAGAGRPDGKGVLSGGMAVTLLSGAPVAIRSLAFGSAEHLDIPWRKPLRKAKRIFHASFDGTATAELACGAAAPLVAEGLAFAPGKRGQAVRLTRKAASSLAYAIDGNFIPTRHTVMFWLRRERCRDSGRQTLFALPSVPAENARGSGAFSAYLQGPNFVLPQMDDGLFTRMHEFAGDGEWHHAALVFHETGGYSFYFDGKGDAWSSDYGNNPFGNAQRGEEVRAFSHRAVFDRFFVGCRGADEQIDGLIDELTVYDGALSWEEVREAYLADGGPDLMKTDYSRLFSRLNRPNPYVAAAKAEPGLPDREVVETIVLDKAAPCARFRHVGEVKVKELGGVPYLEAGAGRDDRFAVGFDIDPAHPLWCVEIDYPDDAKRTMGCVVQDATHPSGDYGGSVGVMCGDEYPSTGRILTHRLYYWAGRGKRAAVVLRTCQPGAPAAASEIRICKVKDSRLPDAGAQDAQPVRGWGRTVGYYFEDPSVVSDFALVPAQSVEGLEKLGERLAAVMRFTGMNLLCYPGAFYNGRIGDGYETRSHMPNYLGGLYERFDREGLGLMPTINQYEVRVPKGLEISYRTVHDGSLYASPANIHATGRVNGRHSHGCPPNWNIAHPYVQEQVARDLDAYVEQGGTHPSFRGVGLHLSKHSILWMGSLNGGYNDYCIDAFERFSGIRVPVDRADPLRGRKYHAFLTGDGAVREKWLDWRCDVVTRFWIGQANRIRAKRADIRLFFNCFLMTNADRDGYGEDGYHANLLRAGGLDVARLTKACDNVVFGMTCVPSDYRHGTWNPGCFAGKNELDIRQWEHGGFFDCLRQAAYPIIHQHERYFESAVGRQGKPGTPNAISCDWITEIPWRVTTVNPGGVHVLRYFVEPLKRQDLLGVTKGGFLIGTYGGEPYLAKFARAFRALPAVLFGDLPSDNPDVTVRGQKVDGRDYAYVVNTSDRPQSVTVSLPAGLRDLVTGEKVTEPRGDAVRLALQPYELKSLGSGLLKSR